MNGIKAKPTGNKTDGRYASERTRDARHVDDCGD